MNQSVKRLVTSGLILLLLALLFVKLAIDTSSLDSGLVRLLGAQRTSAQSKRSSSFSGAQANLQQRRRSAARSRGAEHVGDLFRSNCARCHGADGRGDTPQGHTYNAPDFTDEEWWRKHANITTTGSLVSIVSRGKGGMPAFGKKLKRNEIRLLVNHVRRFRSQR